MPTQSLPTLKSFFETGDKPTQQQFWDWLDSFYHRHDILPATAVEGVAPIILNTNGAAASQTISAGKKVDSIVIEGGASAQTVSIGTVANGNDILDGEYINPNGTCVAVINFYFRNAGTLHFSGLAGSNVIKIYTR